MSPELAEKISFAAEAIMAINPLPISLWTKRALLFSKGYRLVSGVRPCSVCALVSTGAYGRCQMRQVRSFLRNAPSRIGRRLAQIVAIAAASLPAAGA
jgi:hypothetical protein